MRPSSYRGGEEGNRLAEALGTGAHHGWVGESTGRNTREARAGLESEVVSADLPPNREGRWITWEQPTDDHAIAHRGSGRGTSTQSTAQHGSPSAARGRGSHVRAGGSRAGCRRGPPYRSDLPDNRTGREGEDPGSGCASTSQGAGDWREPGNSSKAPAAPRGAVHQGQAGTGLPLLPAAGQGVSSGHPRPCLCARQAERGGAGRGRGDVRRHRSSRVGAMAGRRGRRHCATRRTVPNQCGGC